MNTIPPSSFGRDHWSLLAYVECRAVDDHGVLDKRHLRCHPTRHGLYVAHHTRWEPTWATRASDGTLIPNHDDYDVLADLEAAGYVCLLDLPTEDRVNLTKVGQLVATLLRAHKSRGGQFKDFEVEALAV